MKVPFYGHVKQYENIKDEIDANIKALAVDTTYTNEDRALLAGVSAAVLSDENVRKMPVE